MASAPGAASASSNSMAAASSSSSEFCDPAVEDVPHDCLNDWNNKGLGNQVRMDSLGDTNQNFTEESIPGRCGGTVTTTCPFNGTEGAYFDSQYHGSRIVQLKYGTSNDCLAAASATETWGVLGTCVNTTTGTGGSNGAVFVDHGGYMINVYWTNKGQFGNNAACLESSGTGASSFVSLDYPTGSHCDSWAQF